MRSSVCLAVLAATLTTAVPLASPQSIDFDVYEEALTELLPDVDVPVGDVTQVIHYNPSPIHSSAVAGATSGDLQKRGTCQPYAPGGGPTVDNPDTAQAFLDYPQFASDATNAVTPSGYKAVAGFQNLQAAASDASYLGVNSSLTSYDPAQCAYQCDHREGCVSFNIFYERDPSVDADDTNCPNPASETLIKCSFWGLALQPASATNQGQYRSQFQVVIAGSNAYANTPAPINGFSGPVSLGAAIIQPPNGDNSYMGQQTFANTPYQPQLCADACNAKSAYNTRHAAAGTTPRICNFFDAYILYKDNQNGMFTCMYYTAPWDPSYATNRGQYGGNPESHYTITQSYTYTLNSS